MDFKINDHVRVKVSENLTGKVIDIEEQGDYPYQVKTENGISAWYSSGELILLNKQSNQSDKTCNPSEGVKFDSEKLQWWYLWQFLPELEQVAYVLQYGDKKYYAEDGSNWKRLDKLERRASSAAMRHLSAYLQGNKQDDETTKSHLAHCITNLLFLMYNDRVNLVK